MIESGIENSGEGLLCMLGTSVAIVPNSLELGLERVDEFMRLLDAYGLNSILTRIGEI